MAVLQMQKISICALKKDRKAVLEKLQRMKVTGNSGSVCAGEEVDVFCTGRESADRSR